MKKPMNELIRIVEGAIFASSVPVSAQDISKLFAEDDEEEKPALADIRKAIELLQKGYETRGIRLVEVASGFRFQVADFVAPYIAKSIEDKPARYSRALLETLALIAYRQPITRGEIEDIRGVVVSTNIIKTLDEQEWIRIVGYKDVPGKPALYATTKTFLDHFGLKSLEELPPLAELKAIETVDLADETAQDEGLETDVPDATEVTDGVSQASAEDIANAAIAAAMQSVRNDEEVIEEDLEDEMITADESGSDPVTAALNEIQAAMLQEDEAEIDTDTDTEIDTEIDAEHEEMLDEEDIEEQTLSSILDEIENDRDQEEVL